MTAAAKRPTLVRGTSRQGREASDNILNQGVVVTTGDQTVTLRAGDLTALHSRELRRQVGITFPGLIVGLNEQQHFDIDLIAAVLWLRRLVDGESVTYNEVAGETGYEALENLKIEDADPGTSEGDDPEA
jgi:hypothetical protein